ncbi:hypothetical protein G7046_g5707 [Stylonectria norvegica]|nr:hypothetical protein G7046_g5707 [Stylonectria norvegica]
MACNSTSNGLVEFGIDVSDYWAYDGLGEDPVQVSSPFPVEKPRDRTAAFSEAKHLSCWMWRNLQRRETAASMHPGRMGASYMSVEALINSTILKTVKLTLRRRITKEFEGSAMTGLSGCMMLVLPFRDSIETRKVIEAACPVSSNRAVLQDGSVQKAQDSIVGFVDVFTKICLTDPETKAFCYDTIRSWLDAEKLFRSQNCSDCNLAILQQKGISDLTNDYGLASRYSLLAGDCGNSGYKLPTSATSKTTSHSTASASAISTQSCTSTYTIQAGDTCNGICVAHNASTYAFTQANQLPVYCQHLPAGRSSAYLPNVTFTQLTRMIRAIVLPQPTNLANGTDPRCGKYYNVTAGDSCADITLQAGIALADFYFLNRGVNKGCTNLLYGESYCVLAVGDIKTYPGYGPAATKTKCTASSCYSPDSMFTPVPFPPRDWYKFMHPSDNTKTTTKRRFTPKPAPTLAPGSYDSDRCARYKSWLESYNTEFNSMFNSCEGFVEFWDISVEEFKEWNPSMANVVPCIIKKGTSYCVKLKDASTGTANTTSALATTTSKNTEPSTTSSAKATSSVKTTSSETSSTKAATTSMSGETTPSPHPSAMPAGCKKFYQIKPGDHCAKVCDENKVSRDDFKKWNPSVKSDCSLVEKGVYYCLYKSKDYYVIHTTFGKLSKLVDDMMSSHRGQVDVTTNLQELLEKMGTTSWTDISEIKEAVLALKRKADEDDNAAPKRRVFREEEEEEGGIT